MDKNLNFKGKCPKCEEKGTFSVREYSPGNLTKFSGDYHYETWKEFEYFLFSISSQCPKCLHFISANIAAQFDEEKNKNTDLKIFANTKGDLIEGENLKILFDHPPLIPPRRSPGLSVTQPHHLYEQAKLCFEMNAWDAVGILCRKIIDIQTNKIWKDKYQGHSKTQLYERINVLYEDKEIKKHCANNVRMLGNDAAHSEIIFTREDAESIMIFTNFFYDDSLE